IRRPAGERGAPAAVKRWSHVGGRNTIPPVGSPGAARYPERGGPGVPSVARWADPPAARTGPGMTPAPGAGSAAHATNGAHGGGDRRPLNPWAPSRCEDPLPTLQRPPWGATHGREDAGSEEAFSEPRIQCLLGARRTQPPRARLGQRRTQGVGVVSPGRFL